MEVAMSTNNESDDLLASLKAEMEELRQILRSYERDFFQQHNRQVSSVTDIQPRKAGIVERKQYD